MRVVSRATARSKRKLVVTIIKGWKPLIVVKKSSISDVAVVLDLV